MTTATITRLEATVDLMTAIKDAIDAAREAGKPDDADVITSSTS